MQVEIKSPLTTELLGNKLWVLIDPFQFYVNERIYTIPRGFVYDGNSSPRIMWSICAPAGGSYALAGVVHDYLYSLDCSNIIDRKTADKVHMTIARQNGAGTIRSLSVYQSLRSFGAISYRKKYSVNKLTNKACFDIDYSKHRVLFLKKFKQISCCGHNN